MDRPLVGARRERARRLRLIKFALINRCTSSASSADNPVLARHESSRTGAAHCVWPPGAMGQLAPDRSPGLQGIGGASALAGAGGNCA